MSDLTLSLIKNFKFCSFTVDENRTTKEYVVLRTKFQSSEEAHFFVREVEYSTNTNFRVRMNKPNMQRLLFRKRWVCRNSNFRKKPASKINTGCKSFIDISIKKITYNTRRKDKYLKMKEPLPCVIRINLEHTHSTEDEDFLKKLSMSSEVKKKFFQYFDSGLSPSEAKRVHESQLISCYDHSILSNASFNPTYRQIYYLHEKWSEENFGPSCDPFDKPADITSLSIRDLIPFINLKYQMTNSTDNSNEVHFHKAKDVDCSDEEIKISGQNEQLLTEEGSKVDCPETVCSQDEQITIMDCFSLSSENFLAENIPEIYSGIDKENTDTKFTSQEKSSSVKEIFSFKYLLNNLSLIRKPNDFWGISSHSDVIICARWNENFICAKKVVIENSLILRVFLNEWEINLSEFLSITCMEDLCNILEKVENSIKCHKLK